MESDTPHILIADEDESLLAQFLSGLGDSIPAVQTASSLEDVQRILKSPRPPRVVVFGLSLYQAGLQEILRQASAPWIPILLTVTDPFPPLATQAVNSGLARLLIPLPLDPATLPPIIRQAVLMASGNDHPNKSHPPPNGSSPPSPLAPPQNNKSASILKDWKTDTLLATAHDIRAPLAVMVGYSHMVQFMDEGLAPHSKHMLRKVETIGNRLLQMVSNILSLSSLEEGREKLKPEPCTLEEITEEVLDNLSGFMEQKAIKMALELKNHPRKLYLDRTKVFQILQNLLSNALKFSPQGGEVALKVTGTGEELVVEIRDQGRGLSLKEQQTLFHRFTTFSLERDGLSSGLGLAIAQRLVSLHGGRIWVESQPGSGAAFFFTLKPLAKPAAAKRKSKPSR